MKKSVLAILVLIVFLLMAGCGSSNAPEKTSAAPAAKTSAPAAPEKKEKSMDEKWALVNKEFKAEMSSYPYVIDASATRDEDKKEITFAAILQPSTKPAIALDFADTMLRRYSALAQMFLDKDYKPATKDYYGGLWDDYNAMIIIAPQGATEPKDCFVFDHITRKMHTQQKIELTKKYR